MLIDVMYCQEGLMMQEVARCKKGKDPKGAGNAVQKVSASIADVHVWGILAYWLDVISVVSAGESGGCVLG